MSYHSASEHLPRILALQLVAISCSTVLAGCAFEGIPAAPLPGATISASATASGSATADPFVASREGDTLIYAKDLLLPVTDGKSVVTWRSSPLRIASSEVVGGGAFVYELDGDVQVSDLEAVPVTTAEGVVLQVRFTATAQQANSTLHVYEASASVKLKSEVPDEPRA